MSHTNIGTFRNKLVVSSYERTAELQAPEVVILDRIKDEVGGQAILDLGVGSGRTTPYLTRISDHYVGVDYSPEMIERCRSRYPKVTFERCDARDLSRFASGSFTLVFFSFNGIDYVDQLGRLQILREVRRLLKPNGIFIFSTHNRDADLLPSWHFSRLKQDQKQGPGTLIKHLVTFPVGILLHWLRRKHQIETREYAILNDQAHMYSLLTYYIRVEDQISQLHNAGFRDIEIVGRDGRWLTSEQCRNRKEHWIYYLARR